MPQIDDGANAGGPFYRRLAGAIERDIRSGRLAGGERLPTHRELADRLGVAVGTVSRAYALAQRSGWLRGDVGRGTFVRAGDTTDAGRLEVGTGFALDLSVNLPVAAGAPDLASALRRLARRDDLDRLMRYQPSEGSAVDRRAGAGLLGRHGVEVPDERVVICAGAQHGLNVALDAANAAPGDTVAAAELTWPGLRALAGQRGLRLHPLPLDAEGLIPAALEEACRRSPIRALYTVPSYQNPTGATLPDARRREIARLAERFDFVVIEDDIHRLLLDGDRPPPITALAPDRAIHIASLSKCLSPGLRIAYLAVPAQLRERAVDAVWTSVWNAPPLMAALASQWIGDGTLDEAVARKREEAIRRQSLAREILGIPSSAPSAAYHLWLDLEGRRDATQFSAQAAAEGIRVTAAAAFHVGPSKAVPQAVRLALGAAPSEGDLRRGLEVLGRLLRNEIETPMVRA